MKQQAQTSEPTTGGSQVQPDDQALRGTLEAVCRQIAPVWPLGSFVAVNPYLGFADRSLDDVAEHMAKTAGARTTMPLSF